TVEDPDDWVSGFARDGQNASPDTLTGTVTSETNGIVLAFAGVDSSSGGVSAPSTPANTLQGSTQTINSDSGGVYRITTPGSSTTTVTLPSKNYPTLFVVGVKAGSGGGGATNLTLQGASHAHTTDSLTLSTSSVIAVNSAAHAQSAAITEEVFITVQPTDQTGVVGETETYSVAAVGIGLTYQWFRKEPV
ncbi:hypothetical protein, partial [Hydrogenophaga sp.]|uniref:hypothetical protein n=1 Tax=Hydrogenophaga sp. TaxID=1904254 RepID=UPI0025BEEE23